MQDQPFALILVEDDALDARLIQESLSEAQGFQFELHRESTLQEALDAVAGSEFDAALLDLRLPDSAGLEALKRLHEAVPRLPIILLTGIDDEELAVSSMQHGAQDYLVKGQTDSRAICKAIRYAIERHKMVSEIECARETEHRLAYYDTLTGLPNRQLFYDRLQQALAISKRQQHTLALHFLDLDGFKRVNDTLGHSAGDKLLQQVSARLKTIIRESDTLARLGGDEFVILLPNIGREENAGKIALKIIRDLAKPFKIDQQDVFLTASIGTSLFPLDGMSSEMLIKNADRAMYRAKSLGKNNHQFYNRSMDSAERQMHSIELKLPRALADGQFAIYYQPQLDLASGALTGVEALLRWHDPDLGFISPSQFIPVAEETGIILAIGEWILRAACRQNKEWQDAGLPPVRVAVNLSARQFRDRHLPDLVTDALCETGLEPRYLSLEITETSAMQDIDQSIRILHELSEMGIGVAMDDFGTGYASLNYLKKLPIDVLKIDRSFVFELPDNNEDAAIATAIINLAHSLDKRVIAEGVETRPQLEILQSMHCDEMQGFHFSRPVSAPALARMLKSRTWSSRFVNGRRRQEANNATIPSVENPAPLEA